MSIIQFFSKNFFSKIFPSKYFQEISSSQDATVYPDGLELHINLTPVSVEIIPAGSIFVYVTGAQLNISIGTVTVEIDNPPPPPVKNVSMPVGGFKREPKKKGIVVNLTGLTNVIDIGRVHIEIVLPTWETEEEIIQLITIIFDWLYPDSVTNIVSDEDDSEALSIILSNLL